MPKTEFKYISHVTFTEQTPDMLLKSKQTDSLYEKALFSHVEDSSEYSQNTTTWD